nr:MULTISPECIES: hypothetical protein [unclassified Frankia]
MTLTPNVRQSPLNAALAVIKWKKLAGFYLDLEREHHSLYAINGNTVINEDVA